MERKIKGGLFLRSRQISWFLSIFIVLSFFIFIAGYFLGKKKAADKFEKKVNQDSFADQIYYSVCSMYENDETFTDQESTEDSQASDCLCKNKETFQELQTSIEVERTPVVLIDLKDGCKEQKEDSKNYYAELIGFGTLRCAEKFASKLKNQGFSVVVKRRRSKTAKGKRIVWYQVITEKFDNKNDLIAFVDIIKEKERLKGIRIVEC